MSELSERYRRTRAHSEELCKPLQTEDLVVQPTMDVSPPKWHLAHITWFWEEFVLSPHLPGYRRFHDRYAFLFNSYYNTVGDRVLRYDRGNMSRPTVSEILEYRAYVDKHMDSLLTELPDQLEGLVELGINHEQQHQELLLTDIKYILGHNPLFPPYRADFKESKSMSGSQEWLDVNGGIYAIGHEGTGFCFDNEGARHEVLLAPFSISNRLVTNAEYLAFVEDRGYENHAWWHSDAWTWIAENDIFAPLYWHQIDGQWMRYALSGLEPLPMHEPVTHLSYYEAAAFAEWSGARLPTEFEWEAASEKFHWGERWEHTASAYLPYPGFAKAEGAIGEYNGKFMVNQMVLRGASIATPEGHARHTYRNFFHPHLRWQFTGIRLCKK